jgi:hypothetical protein
MSIRCHHLTFLGLVAVLGTVGCHSEGRGTASLDADPSATSDADPVAQDAGRAAPDAGPAAPDAAFVPPGEGTLFRMDESQPDYGMVPVANEFYTATRQVDACPTGGDAVRITVNPQTFGAQYDIGFSVPETEAQDVPVGERRYLRYRIRPVGPQNYTGNGDPWSTKFTIYGAEEGRVIVWYGVGGENDTDTHVSATKNISGLGAGLGAPLPEDEWSDLQVELESSASDGAIRAWLDNDDHDNPTGQGNVGPLSTLGWGGQTGFGGFASPTLTPDVGRVVFDVCDFEVGTEFHPRWNVGP